MMECERCGGVDNLLQLTTTEYDVIGMRPPIKVPRRLCKHCRVRIGKSWAKNTDGVTLLDIRRIVQEELGAAKRANR